MVRKGPLLSWRGCLLIPRWRGDVSRSDAHRPFHIETVFCGRILTLQDSNTQSLIRIQLVIRSSRARAPESNVVPASTQPEVRGYDVVRSRRTQYGKGKAMLCGKLHLLTQDNWQVCTQESSDISFEGQNKALCRYTVSNVNAGGTKHAEVLQTAGTSMPSTADEAGKEALYFEPRKKPGGEVKHTMRTLTLREDENSSEGGI